MKKNMKEDCKLSIVIPVWNKFNFTRSCLKDLLLLPNYCEIIVVDNGSSDETQETLKNNKDVVYLRNEENEGFAKACNKGFRASQGESVLFLNNDIRVKSDHETWVNKIIEVTDNEEDILAGPTGGLVSDEFEFMYETAVPEREINYISGWCVAASKSTWNKLDISGFGHVFSEEFGIAFFEDTDLSFRATELGIKFKLVPIPLVHFGHVTARALGVRSLYSEAKRIFCEKWKKRKSDVKDA